VDFELAYILWTEEKRHMTRLCDIRRKLKGERKGGRESDEEREMYLSLDLHC
jgi:hypothetical protein